MDLVTNVARIPAPGETVIGGDLLTVPGGKGANQAVATARLGASTTMVGRVGNDAFAGQLLENLTVAGVDHTYVIKDREAASGVALIAVESSGQNSIVVAPGANSRLSPKDVEQSEAAIRSADLILLQLEVPMASVLRAAQLASKHGVPVILNPAPAQNLPRELLSLVDFLIPNESETALLTNLPTTSYAEIDVAARKLLQLGVEAVIMTLGERGSLLAQQGKLTHFPAFRPDKVVDTTAAGDAFVGGFATAMAEGRSLAESVLWGNAAGSIAVTRLGAQPSLPRRRETKNVLTSATEDQLKGVVK